MCAELCWTLWMGAHMKPGLVQQLIWYMLLQSQAAGGAEQSGKQPSGAPHHYEILQFFTTRLATTVAGRAVDSPTLLKLIVIEALAHPLHRGSVILALPKAFPNP